MIAELARERQPFGVMVPLAPDDFDALYLELDAKPRTIQISYAEHGSVSLAYYGGLIVAGLVRVNPYAARWFGRGSIFDWVRDRLERRGRTVELAPSDFARLTEEIRPDEPFAVRQEDESFDVRVFICDAEAIPL